MPGVISGINDKIRFFGEQLVRKEGIQDWQVEQAQRAIELYERVFLKEGRPSSEPAQPISEGETACGRMRELIRLRHYSLRTEQTYLDWVQMTPVTCG